MRAFGKRTTASLLLSLSVLLCGGRGDFSTPQSSFAQAEQAASQLDVSLSFTCLDPDNPSTCGSSVLFSFLAISLDATEYLWSDSANFRLEDPVAFTVPVAPDELGLVFGFAEISSLDNFVGGRADSVSNSVTGVVAYGAEGQDTCNTFAIYRSEFVYVSEDFDVSLLCNLSLIHI